MKVYSNIIIRADVYAAATLARQDDHADIWIDDAREFSPRRHYAHGVEFWAHSHNGKRAAAHGPISSGPRDDLPRAASWSDYGYLIAHLYNMDPHARIGQYDSEADFVQRCQQAHDYAASYMRPERVERERCVDFLDVLTNRAEYAS